MRTEKLTNSVGKALLEMLIVAQLVKKFSAIFTKSKFSTVTLKQVCHVSTTDAAVKGAILHTDMNNSKFMS
jgi:hypothetical protein